MREFNNKFSQERWLSSHAVWDAKNQRNNRFHEYSIYIFQYFSRQMWVVHSSVRKNVLNFLFWGTTVFKTSWVLPSAFLMVWISGTGLRKTSSSSLSLPDGFSLGLLLSPSALQCFNPCLWTILWLFSCIFWIIWNVIPSAFCVNSHWRLTGLVLTIHCDP